MITTNRFSAFIKERGSYSSGIDKLVNWPKTHFLQQLITSWQSLQVTKKTLTQTSSFLINMEGVEFGNT